MKLYDSKYYLESSDVKVFPCAYRSGYDAGSRINTEFNLIKQQEIIGRGTNAADEVKKISYITSAIYDDDNWTIKCIIAGYNFELKIASSDAILLKGLHAYIKVAEVQSSLNYNTSSLSPFLTEKSATIVDNKIEDSDNTQYFLALCFAENKPSNATYSLDIFDASGNIIKSNLYANTFKDIESSLDGTQITGDFINDTSTSGVTSAVVQLNNGVKNNSAAANNAIALGDHTIADKENLVAVGKYNTTEEKDLFVVGNGSSTASKSNVLQVNEDKIVINQSLNTKNISASGAVSIKPSTSATAVGFTIYKTNGASESVIADNGGALRATSYLTCGDGTNNAFKADVINKFVAIGQSSNANKFKVATDTGYTEIAGDLNINSGEFKVTASSGKTEFAGDLEINTNKFKVTASSGATEISGKVSAKAGLDVTNDSLTVGGENFTATTAGNLTAKGEITLGESATDITGDEARSAVKIGKSGSTTQVKGILQVDGVTNLKGTTNIVGSDSSNKITLNTDGTATFTEKITTSNGIDNAGKEITTGTINSLTVSGTDTTDTISLSGAAASGKTTTLKVAKNANINLDSNFTADATSITLGSSSNTIDIASGKTVDIDANLTVSGATTIYAATTINKALTVGSSQKTGAVSIYSNGANATGIYGPDNEEITLPANISAGVSGKYVFAQTRDSGSLACSMQKYTNENTANTIVYRDSSGNFSAGTITATLSGNASTASLASKTDNLFNLSVGIGATNAPVYMSYASGMAKLAACSTYAGGTKVTLNGTSKASSTADFYAPTSAGTSGAILYSTAGTPGWTNTDYIKIDAANGYVYSYRYYTFSDIRKKENIVDYKPKKSILDLSIKKFDFINGPKNQIGCIAQELQEICPEVVNEDSDGYLKIEENKIVYLLLDEVKKLRQEINLLKGE